MSEQPAFDESAISAQDADYSNENANFTPDETGGWVDDVDA